MSGSSDNPSEGSAVWCWPLAMLLACLAGALVIATLDSSGAVPQLGEGPGLTLDETFNVQMGVYHVRAIREYGLGLLHPESVREVFAAPGYNPDHPPLGRVLIGLAHDVIIPYLSPGAPPGHLVVTCGRAGSAIAFAVTVFLVCCVTTRWYGRAAGGVAGISLILMPRVFAHAHLAALETSLGLVYTSTVLLIASSWQGERLRWRFVLLAGVLFGLTLLTKIQAVLLPVPIALWALWRWRLHALIPLFVFGVTGVAVFFLGWPWLWLDPIGHLSEYFGRTTQRQSLDCWYLGQEWADVDVPWHYPLVMFVVTVPLGLHVLGVLGAIGHGRTFFVVRRSEYSAPAAEDSKSAERTPSIDPAGLVLLNVIWPLVFFALPGITVYDGSRLFLMVFPLWAVLIGRGAAALTAWLKQHWSDRTVSAVLVVLVTLQAYGIVTMHPLQLSYYNLLVGGLRGASRLGFELTYWGDSVTRSLLGEINALAGEPGSVVDVAPVLHPFQLQELKDQTPEMRYSLRAFDDTTGRDVRHVLVFRRRADSWASLTPQPPASERRAAVVREGIPLAEFYRIAAGTFEHETQEN